MSMEACGTQELLECVFVGMDPSVATGAVVEVYREDGGYVLLVSSAATGSRFSTGSKSRAYDRMFRELGPAVR